MILAHLKPLLAELFDVSEDEIVRECDFVEDLGADSLDIVELLMIVEEEFDFKNLDKIDLTPYHTVGDLVDFIERGGKC